MRICKYVRTHVSILDPSHQVRMYLIDGSFLNHEHIKTFEKIKFLFEKINGSVR